MRNVCLIIIMIFSRVVLPNHAITKSCDGTPNQKVMLRYKCLESISPGISRTSGEKF